MESGDYECAIRSFEHARAQLHNRTSRPPLMVSLVNFPPLPRDTLSLVTVSDRYPDGNLTVSVSRFNSAFVKPSMQQVVQRRRVRPF